MRSKKLQELLDEMPEELKQKVDAYIDAKLNFRRMPFRKYIVFNLTPWNKLTEAFNKVVYGTHYPEQLTFRKGNDFMGISMWRCAWGSVIPMFFFRMGQFRLDHYFSRQGHFYAIRWRSSYFMIVFDNYTKEPPF